MNKNQIVRWIKISIFIIVIGSILYSARYWLPYLLANIPRKNDAELFGPTIEFWSNVLTIVSVIGGLLAGAWRHFIFTEEKEEKKQTHFLTKTDPDRLLEEYIGDSWKDTILIVRNIVGPSDLRKYPVVIITGGMKSGKSREAIELIRGALDAHIIPSSKVYDITEDIRRYTPDEIKSLLNDKINSESHVLFFLDQLQSNVTEKQIKALNQYIQASSFSYFVSTARIDHLEDNPLMIKWMKEVGAQQFNIKPLTSEQQEMLIEDLINKYQIQLDDPCKNELIRLSDGTPYHLILTFQKFSKDKSQPLNLEEVREIASKSTEDIWIDIRRECQNYIPAVGSILKALSYIYHTGVTANTRLVVAFAGSLEGSRKKTRLTWKKHNSLEEALKLLEHYGISHQDNFTYPDVAVESLSTPEESLRNLEAFLSHQFFHPIKTILFKPVLNPRIAGMVFLELGINNYYSGNFVEAEQNYHKAIEVDPKLAQAWFSLGVLYQEQNNLIEAVHAYKQAIETDPKLAQAWSNLGVLCEKLGMTAEAMHAYEQAIEVDKKFALAWYNRGSLLIKKGNIAKAEQAFREALEVDPKLAQAWFSLGLLYREQNNVIEAVHAYEQAVEADPKLVLAWSNLGVLYKGLDNINKAESAFHKALETDPEFAPALNELGSLLYEIDNIDDAELAFHKAVEADPECEPAWNNLGVLLYKKGNFREAEHSYCKAVQVDPEFMPAWNNLLALLENQDKNAEADQAYRNANEGDLEIAGVWNNLGVRLEKQGETAKAEQAYRKAVKVDPIFSLAWNNLALLLEKQGNYYGAEQAYRKAVEVDPKWAEAWNKLGVFLKKGKRYIEAVDPLTLAVKLAPQKAYYHSCLWYVLNKLERKIEAQIEFDEAQRLSENECKYDQACIAALCGEVDKSLTLLEEVIRNNDVTKDLVLKDSDWDDLREYPRFRKIVGE